jgi:hypothetical protein
MATSRLSSEATLEIYSVSGLKDWKNGKLGGEDCSVGHVFKLKAVTGIDVDVEHGVIEERIRNSRQSGHIDR